MDSERIEKKEAERIVRIVEEGRSSEYWKILAKWIESEIDKEDRFLEEFKSRGISESGTEAYNNALRRIKFMKKLLKVNEIIIDEKMSIFNRIESVASNVVERVKSFVDILK